MVNCLNDVTRVLARATEFWENLQRHCEKLAAGDIKPMIEESYTKEERIGYWTSPSFKEKAVPLLCQVGGLSQLVCQTQG